MANASLFAKRVEGRQEEAQLDKLLEMRGNFRFDLTDLRAALKDLRGIDIDKDKAIDNFEARIDRHDEHYCREKRDSEYRDAE